MHTGRKQAEREIGIGNIHPPPWRNWLAELLRLLQSAPEQQGYG